MELFVPKLDQHAPCFAISEKAYGHTDRPGPRIVSRTILIKSLNLVITK